MTNASTIAVIGLGLSLSLIPGQDASGQSVDLGDGFIDHGPAAPVSTQRGIVSVADGDGRDVVLVWLYDTGNTYALLQIDAETGETVEYTPPATNCAPYASILSNAGRYYTHFASHFIEFDPVVGEITFTGETVPRSAMSMTEDDDGVIWAAAYPDSGVASYDPQSGEFRDYGSVNEHPSLQYPRTMAVDDQGWAYIGIGLAAARVVILDRETGETTAVDARGDDAEKGFGNVALHRDRTAGSTAALGLTGTSSTAVRRQH